MDNSIKIIPRNILRKKYSSRTPKPAPYRYLEFQDKKRIIQLNETVEPSNFFKRMRDTIVDIWKTTREEMHK